MLSVLRTERGVLERVCVKLLDLKRDFQWKDEDVKYSKA